jgi:hypothetical protein
VKVQVVPVQLTPAPLKVNAPTLLLMLETPLPPIAAHPVAFPFANIPVGAIPFVQVVGAEARAVAVAAFPEVFAALFGMSPLSRVGN